MTSFGWKRKLGEKVKSQPTSGAFNESEQVSFNCAILQKVFIVGVSFEII